MPDIHSLLGASSAHRWMNCPGCIRLIQASPEPKPALAAVTGTIAHKIGEMCLNDRRHPSEFIGQKFHDDTGTFDIEVTDEMAEAVAVYVDKVRADQAEFGGELYVEKTFTLNKFYPGMFGTNDSCLLSPWGGTLRIYDYKNGTSPVQARGNVQMMYYALGALTSFQSLWPETVVCTIVQPNCFGKAAIDSWEVSSKELLRWAKEELVPAAKRTEDPEAPCVPGSWCQFCPAMGVCPDKKKEVMSHIGGTEEAPILPAAETMAPDAIGRAAAFFTSKAFTMWLDAVCEAELGLLQRGVKIAGRKLVERQSYGNRKWADENAVVEKLSSMVGDDLFDHKMKSPSQVEKLITSKKLMGKKELSEALAPLVTREVTTKQVVESVGSSAEESSLLLSTPVKP